MRTLTIIEAKPHDGLGFTHVQDMTTGQIWRADSKRRGLGPFVPGRLPSVKADSPNRYARRLPGQR